MRTLWLSWHIQVGTHSFSFNPPNPVWNVPGNSRIVWSRLQQVPINCLSVSFGNLLGNIPSGNLVQTLQELSIVWDCWSIRSHAKVAIGQLANLKLLSLLSLELRPDQWRDLAGQLPDMPHLHTLIIDNTGTIPDTVLQDMGQLSCLRTLVLKSCNWLTDNAVSSWTALTNLEALDLSFCCFLTAACLPLIGQLSNIRKLRIDVISVLPAEMLLLAKGLCTSLQELSMVACPGVTDDLLEVLAGLVNLERLNLSDCLDITDRGLLPLSGLPCLQYLNISYCTKGGTDLGMEYISRMQTLTELDLHGCVQVTDNGLRKLGKLSNLRNLTLSGCWKLTDNGLRCGINLHKLESLNL